jgi:hypothetical protein
VDGASPPDLARRTDKEDTSMQSLDQLMLFNAGWWVFATAAAFVAAALFWNKGAAQITGSPVGAGMAMKMSGAGAIWGITLLLFSYFQPMKDFGNANHIVLITTTQETSRGAELSLVSNDPGIVKALKEAHDHFGDADLGLELIYRKAAFQLTQEAGNAFGYPDPIPAGYYELRVTNTKTGAMKSWGLELTSPVTTAGSSAGVHQASTVPAQSSVPAR